MCFLVNSTVTNMGEDKHKRRKDRNTCVTIDAGKQSKVRKWGWYPSLHSKERCGGTAPASSQGAIGHRSVCMQSPVYNANKPPRTSRVFLDCLSPQPWFYHPYRQPNLLQLIHWCRSSLCLHSCVTAKPGIAFYPGVMFFVDGIVRLHGRLTGRN